MTENAVLRPLCADDAADVLAGFDADPQMERQGNVTDLETSQTYIAFLTSSEDRNHGFAIAVEGRCTGVVAINGSNRHRLGWFFYWMHPDFRSRGLTSRAAAAAANWALRPRDDDGGDFERLELGHRANNPGSGRVAEAAGFIKEGHERQKFVIHGERVDALTYGRLRTDPAPSIRPLPLRMD